METATQYIKQAQAAKKKPARWPLRKIRFFTQLFALGLNIWIGIEFYLFVSFIKSGESAGLVMSRPPGVEGYLPISALLSLRDWVLTGVLNSIHPASVVILLVIVGTAFIFKKAFCSWVCPVGFVSELVGNTMQSMHHLKLRLPRWLDWPLRSLKYILLGLFVYAVFFFMSPAEVRSFIASPYNKVADIKMMYFFLEIGLTSLIVITGIFLFSLILRGFWCRYLCPYGALLGMASLIGPAKITRNEHACISCGKCTQVCPSHIKVDTSKQVLSDECSGCLDCIDVCPARGALTLGLRGSKRSISPRAWVLAIVIFFWGSLAIFSSLGPWQNSISVEEYRYHITRMHGSEYGHPGR